MSKARGPKTFSKSVRYGRCEMRRTTHAGSRFAISVGLTGEPCACEALEFPNRNPVARRSQKLPPIKQSLHLAWPGFVGY